MLHIIAIELHLQFNCLLFYVEFLLFNNMTKIITYYITKIIYLIRFDIIYTNIQIYNIL